MARIVAVRGRSCFVNSCRISHFGMKPVSGGRPPSESKRRAVVDTIVGAFGQVRARVLIFVADRSLRVKKAALVIII